MVEKRLAALDGAEASAGFCSGMAAISTLFMAYLKPGDAVLHSLPLYGGADGLLEQGHGRLRRAQASSSPTAWTPAPCARPPRRAMAAGPVRMIWLESPANPTGDGGRHRAGRPRSPARSPSGRASGRWSPSTTPSSGPLLQSPLGLRRRPLHDLADQILRRPQRPSGRRRSAAALELSRRCAPLRTSLGNHHGPAHGLAAAALARDAAGAHQRGPARTP